LPPTSPNRRKSVLLAVKLVIVAMVTWWVVVTFRDAWGELAQGDWSLDPLWLVLSAGLYLLGLLPSGLFWHRLLNRLGQQAQLGETLRAYYIGHLGKYVPGKALVVILRTGLIRSHRVDATLAAVSVFIETLTMMAVGAAIAASVLLVVYRDRVESLMLVGAVGLLVLAGLPTLPPVVRAVVRRLGLDRKNPQAAEALEGLTYGVLLGGWISVGLGWCLLAGSLWATLRAVGQEVDLATDGPLLVASVTLSMVAGFLSLIPGGAVVRDSVLAKLLSLHYPKSGALAAAIVLRLVWLVAELIISAILYIGSPRPEVPPEGTPSSSDHD
jgi:uncharacterized membrane protein YbhN (UPF0104 family)